MASVPYSGAPSAVGYQHQTWWALYELLRSGIDRPDAAITLELYDDVAWEENGTPTQLLQLKHHQNTYRALTDTSTDLWRTLRVWMNTAIPGDAAGAQLLLVTTQTASSGTAVAALRPDTFDIKVALTGLEAVAHQATSQQTELARTQFLTLNSSDRRAFISRIRIIDSSPCINDIQKLVRARLLWALPTGREELFLAMVWNWWDEQSLTMLQGRRRSVDIGTARTAIAEIRDQFTCESLPTLVELRDVDEISVAATYQTYLFVQQMRWIACPPRNLQKAIVDYYRAYSQAVRWIDEDLIGVAELTKFETDLIDEWEREFEWMLDTLGDDADEDAKQQAGKQLLRQLLDHSGIVVRPRYDQPFFARGRRHVLADTGRIGWHPDFESRVHDLLAVNA